MGLQISSATTQEPLSITKIKVKPVEVLVQLPSWNEPTASNQNEEEHCSICLQELQENIFQTKCKHKFHKECLEKWLDVSRVCPLCKTALKREVNDGLDEVFQMAEYRYTERAEFSL